MAMSVELNLVELEDFVSQDSVQQNGFSVWGFLEMMNSGKLTRGIAKETISMAIEDVYREIVGDVLKEVLALSVYILLIIISFCFVLTVLYWSLIIDIIYICVRYEILRFKVLCVLTPGISVEERSVKEKLDRALVHLETQYFNLFHQRGPQRSQGQHSARRKLLCRGGVQVSVVSMCFVIRNKNSLILYWCGISAMSREYI